MSNRNYYKYHFKVGNKIVHRGITNDLDRREEEHQQKWANGHITQQGNAVSKESALDWERDQHERFGGN